MENFLFNFLEFFVLLAFFPVLVMFSQVLLVGLNRYYSHYKKCGSYTPRVAAIISAWNEADVIGNTIESLIHSNYDREKLRIYLVDDNSSDNTLAVATAKMEKYPDVFFYLRRERGGEGKAFPLNYGLKHILSESWAEAILVVDADILFKEDCINRMVRHLADPKVGCVTCYIKEGNIPGNIITRFIAYEYIISTAVVRRSQNVIGVLACVAGGAQLHSRANIEVLGGEIDGTTLAEDTYTTFQTQILNHSAIFEGNAVVRSEEPDNVLALWKQRKRWARGNIQLTKIFRHLWFHPKDKSGLGGIFFGLVWFSILLLPFLMIPASICLVAIYFLQTEALWSIFYLLGGVSAFIYLFIVFSAFLVDFETMKRSWREALLFPGLIAVFSLAMTFAPNFFINLFTQLLGEASFDYWEKMFLLFVSIWVGACMFFAWIIYRLARAQVSPIVVNFLLILVGYGPLLCVITISAFISEWTKVEPHWDKTEKVGKLPLKIQPSIEKYNFSKILHRDEKNEVSIFWKEIFIIVVLTILFIVRHYYEF